MRQTFKEFIGSIFKVKEPEPLIGTFAGLILTQESIDILDEFCYQFNIPNKVDEYHSTIMYSRKEHPDFQPLGKTYYATPSQFDVFHDRTNNTNCLVLKYNSIEVEKRHYNIRQKYGATYDFENFIPHVTLSYDIGDFDISTLNVRDLNCGMLEFSGEYFEPLSESVERRQLSDRRVA
jgi:hypothetical protein